MVGCVIQPVFHILCLIYKFIHPLSLGHFGWQHIDSLHGGPTSGLVAEYEESSHRVWSQLFVTNTQTAMEITLDSEMWMRKMMQDIQTDSV